MSGAVVCFLLCFNDWLVRILCVGCVCVCVFESEFVCVCVCVCVVGGCQSRAEAM